MYINRSAEEIVKLSILAAHIQYRLFDNRIKAIPVEAGIKKVAEQFSVSEKQLHFWKNLLIKEGLKVFSLLRPGRKKKEFSSLKECEKLLVYETVNHTAGLKVDKICKRIQEKNKLENENVLKNGLCLPPGDKLKEAKDEIVALIRRSYCQCKREIPAFQGLRQLWKNTVEKNT